MVKFITQRIEQAADTSIEEGQAKYNAYFVNTHIYEKYRATTEAKLIEDGYSEVIPVK